MFLDFLVMIMLWPQHTPIKVWPCWEKSNGYRTELGIGQCYIFNLTDFPIGYLSSNVWLRLASITIICFIPHVMLWMRVWIHLMISLNMLLRVISWFYPINDDDCLSWDGFTWLTYIDWMMDLDVGFTLFSPKGQDWMVLWSLPQFWRCSLKSTIFIYPFHTLFEWVAWSSCMVGIEGDGGRWSDLGQREPWEVSQRLFCDPVDISTRVFSTRIHTTGNLYGFKVKFYDVPGWPCGSPNPKLKVEQFELWKLHDEPTTLLHSLM